MGRQMAMEFILIKMAQCTWVVGSTTNIMAKALNLGTMDKSSTLVHFKKQRKPATEDLSLTETTLKVTL